MNDSITLGGLPLWLLFVTCGLALVVGKIIRFWYLRNKELKLARERQELKEEKKALKRERKMHKKAQKKKH